MILVPYHLVFKHPILPKELTLSTILGVLNNVIYLGCTFKALEYVSASVIILIVSTAPFITSLIGRYYLGESLSKQKIVGLVIGFSGVALVMQGRVEMKLEIFGVFLALVGTLAFSIATVVYRKRAAMEAFSPISINGWQSTVGGLTVLPIALLSENFSINLHSAIIIGVLSYLVLVVSIAGFFLWFFLIRISSASVASSFHFLNPVFGLVLSMLLLGETLYIKDLGAIAIVSVGVILVSIDLFRVPKPVAL